MFVTYDLHITICNTGGKPDLFTEKRQRRSVSETEYAAACAESPLSPSYKPAYIHEKRF